MDNELKNQLDCNVEVRKHLFEKGFLITDAEIPDLSVYPFYGNWSATSRCGYNFIVHNECSSFFLEQDDGLFFLIGYAFNPFDGYLSEEEILCKLSQLHGDDFWKYESQLTGIYVIGKIEKCGTIYHWTDCAGMRISYYGKMNGKYYITSHANLVAYLLNLKEDSYITKLKNGRFFHLFGAVLPADLSPYTELKRTVPNHMYGSDASCMRFFPLSPIVECRTEDEYKSVLVESATILKKTLVACAEKYKNRLCAISVTGGKDSGETLASANGCYEKFKYFSYISKPEEAVDAHAASHICKELGLEHQIIEIPKSNSDITNFGLLREIIYCNSGDVGYLKDNEIRKRAQLISNPPADVEIKSWVNEITRAYWYKKYSKTKFLCRPTGRLLATLYKVFVFNRLDFVKTARRFKEYINRYISDKDIELFGDWTTLWDWEFGFSANEGLHLFAEHVLAFDVLIPFNNRHLIALMLKPKLKDRIQDRLQRDIILLNNERQANLNVNVVNAAHTSRRAFLEKMYLLINSHLPF